MAFVMATAQLKMEDLASTYQVVILAAIGVISLFLVVTSCIGNQLMTKSTSYMDLPENIDDWWNRNKDHAYSRLIVPPQCVAPKALRSNSPVQQTKQLMHKLYRTAMGSGQRNKYNLTGFTINEQTLPDDFVPLLCFVNSKSGGRQGEYFRYELRHLLNPVQVVDLKDIDPVQSLKAFANVPRFRVLVAGGDGTLGWVLSAIEQVTWKHHPPAVAILPIGTGNDLAIELGWLAPLRTNALNVILEKVLKARVVKLDRWTFSSTTLTKTRSHHSNNNNSKASSVKSTAALSQIKFQNYCGIGVDAQIVLQFHLMRNASPNLFVHSYVNKFWYGIMGWNEIWHPAHESFTQQVSLICDGVEIELPADIQGIVFLNISSYAGGSALWSHPQSSQGGFPSMSYDVQQDFAAGAIYDDDSGLNSRSYSQDNSASSSNLPSYSLRSPSLTGSATAAGAVEDDKDACDDLQHKGEIVHRDREDHTEASTSSHIHGNKRTANKRRGWVAPSINDGLLEVVGVRNSLELAQIKLGITSCQKVAQGRRFEVTLKARTAIQFDGEPRMQSPGTFVIEQSSLFPQADMLKPVPDDMDVDLVEVLDWAQRHQVITSTQQSVLMQEYIQRVEARQQQWRDVGW